MTGAEVAQQLRKYVEGTLAWHGMSPVASLCTFAGLPTVLTRRVLLSSCVCNTSLDSLLETPGAVLCGNTALGVYLGGGEVAELQEAPEAPTVRLLEDTDWKRWALLPNIDYAPLESAQPRMRHTEPIPYSVPERELSYGCEGDDVRWVQHVLKVPITGYYTSTVTLAVLKFQRDKHIPAMGVVNQVTLNRLKEVL